MVLYIDKENLISLVQSKNKGEFVEYAALIRKNLDVQYNFPKDEIPKDEYLSFWFNSLAQGVSGKQEFCPPKNVIPEIPRKSNFYNSLPSSDRSSIFFFNDEGKATVAEAKCCVIVSKVGDEMSKLKELYSFEEKGEVLAYKIPNWSSYLPHLPLTDIIISDNHYFKDKYVYDTNDNELIRFLSSIPQQIPVNVVIIAKEGEIDPAIDLTKEQESIKSIVKAASGSTKSTVTIVTTYKNHDRALITNYYRVNHGSCFHLKENNLKHDVKTEVKTHGMRKNHSFTKELIAEYQDVISNPSKCIGDKVSNILVF